MKRDPVVDGLRGLSIVFVILGHMTEGRFGAYFRTAPFHDIFVRRPLDLVALLKNIAFRLVLPLPQLGVYIFFVISGFLITRLLLEEEHKTGKINIFAFYIRRCFRIWPAFYVFLLVCFFLVYIGSLPIRSWQFVSAAGFFANTPWNEGNWWLGHSWSLSVEEQFYILWPACFLLLGKKHRARGLAVILAGLMIFSALNIMKVSWIDNAASFGCIAIGALYAASGVVARIFAKWAGWLPMLLCSLFILFVPFVESNPLATKCINTVTPILIAVLVFGTVNRKGFLLPLVSTELFRLVGVVSYSLYLWQQIFLASPGAYGVSSLLRITLLFIPCALLSYFLVEKPMNRLGHRLSRHLMRQGRPSDPAVLSAPQEGA